MTEYKIDVSFDSTIFCPRLNVFDLDTDEHGAVDSCAVGHDLDDRNGLREAWGRYHDSNTSESERYELVMAMDTGEQVVKLLLFDEEEKPGPLDECAVGKGLDHDLLSEAFHRYHERRERDLLDR